MSDRLSRKEIKKQDQFVTTVEESLDFATRYRREILVGIAALVVVVLGVVGWRAWASSREAKASEALTAAMETYQAPVASEGSPPPEAGELSFPDEESRTQAAAEAFHQVQADFGGSRAAQIAGVYLARFAVEDGRLEDAEALWSDLAEAGAGDPLAVQARLNLINLERSRGQHEQVLAELEAMLEAGAETGLPDDTVLYELGATLEDLDRPVEAESYYQRLADEYPDSAYAGQASQRLASLGSQAGAV